MICLRRGQHTRRLIQDQDIRLSIQRLQDLNPLVQTDRKVLNHRVGINVHLIVFGQLTQQFARLAKGRLQQPAFLGT